ncbi:hypothetical protein EV702DRAFT_1196772 [Suillus placidus]|uniref:Uncharacterized protein n=1 Tax=Suillus placidus TaxID=48579 RepID=A0A9P6ZXI3_9AGAM|nr:hypothetical protein EV702DRAFT_1196772 [Suillus placidus]
MAARTMPSGSQDLPVAPLPLTQTQRDELDQAIHTAGMTLLRKIRESETAHTNLELALLAFAFSLTTHMLNRTNLKNVLDPDMLTLATIQQHPQLRKMIRNACQTDSPLLTVTGNAEMLQNSDASPPMSKLAQGQDEFEFLYDSFVRPYIGEAVDGFYEYLKNDHIKFKGGGRSRPYYAKFCSIVQSSGTGKSRLMTEATKGFPKRDLVPARILTEYTTGCTQAEYSARSCAFFTAIFGTLQQDLSSQLPALRSGSSDDAIKAWNDKICDMRSEARTEFFEIVKIRYQATLDQIKIPKESTNVATEHAAKKGPWSSKPKAPKERTGVALTLESADAQLRDEKVDVPKLEGESFLKNAFQDMVIAMPHIFAAGKRGEKALGNEPKLVIAFDEAHPLSKLSSQVWVVFASTTSQVADFSAPQVIHNSQRVPVAGEILYPPYTDLGWDQLAIPLGDISANDVAKFHHIVGFGRPLWKSHVQEEIIDGVVELAAQKLCKSKTFDPKVTNQALAVLSQRFGLDICFGHPDAVSYIETGVASHLRVRFSTTEDRIWSFTGYPSEPLLSCVAAILLHETPNHLKQALQVLREKADSGMVEIGQSGELTSRLLLLLAKDLFIRHEPSQDVIQDLHYNRRGDAELLDCQKVSVIEFPEYLFGMTFWSKAGEDAAYINFSHWVPMTEFISPPDDSEHTTAEESRCDAQEWTLRHWHRTSAVQCCPLQPLVDKMIPIYFDDPALGSEDMKRVSQIFISDKAGKNHLPYIALLLDLNVGLNPQLTVTFPERDPSHAVTDRCLRIYASGMSTTTFPFLEKHPEIAVELKGLLSRQKEAPPETALRALVKFGSTARLRNSRWEAQQKS